MDAKCEPIPKISPNDPLPSGEDVINKLPNEVLLKIFGYLNSKFIVKNISKVSQRFEELSKEPTLLRKIVFYEDDCSNESMVQALERSKNLSELCFVDCHDPYITNFVILLIARFTSLIEVLIKVLLLETILFS